MDKLVYLLPVLGCAVMMGLMMWLMRANHGGTGGAAQPDPNTAEELARLRAEVADLRARQGLPADGADHGTRRL